MRSRARTRLHGWQGSRDRPTRSTKAALALATAFAAAGAPAAQGQTPRWELDVNGSRIEYDTVPPLSAPSISTLAEWRRPTWYGRASGSLTGFEGSTWTAQGRGDLAAWLSPLGAVEPVRLEFSGTAGGSRHSSGFSSVVGRGAARLHVVGRGVGGWGGVTVARARNSFDTASVGGVMPSVGLWGQTGSARATLSYLHGRVAGDTYPEANVAVSLSRGDLDLTVYGGLRRPPAETGLPSERWAGAAATMWVHPRAALTVAGGQYASDVLQGLPGGQFASIGFRITTRRARPIPVSAPAPIVYTSESARAGGIGFTVDGAERVEIAGDWNAWQPTPLERGPDGRWMLPVSLSPGVYRFNLRVDDDRWIVPPGVPEMDDGFGGRVGLLVVSG